MRLKSFNSKGFSRIVKMQHFNGKTKSGPLNPSTGEFSSPTKPINQSFIPAKKSSQFRGKIESNIMVK
jgi:hypothetical protein